MSETRRAGRPWIVVVALYLALRLPALFTYSPTYDEPIYIAAGKHFAVLHDTQAAAMLYHPPLSYHLTSLPLWFVNTPLEPWDSKGFGSQVGVAVLYGSHASDGTALSPQTVLLLSRLPILAFGLLGLVFCRLLGRRLAGDRAGWLAAAAWAAYPEAVAQSVQATTDLVAAVCALLLACAALRHFDMIARRPQNADWTHVALGAACGVAALAKHTLLLPIVIVTVAAVWLRIARSRAGMVQPRQPALRFVLAAAVAFFVLWAGYLFEVGPIAAATGGPHAHAASIVRFTGLDPATVDRWLETVSVPAPTYWRSVVDAFLDKARARGGTTWIGYLNGETSESGFLWYFPIALVVKTPLALLAVMAAGLVGWGFIRREAGVAADLCLALFAIPFAAAVASRLNIGVRHLLPCAPFLLILGCAAIADLWKLHPALTRAAVVLLAAALAAEWDANRGDPLPFANVVSGGPNGLHRRLADSNLEVGQDLWALERWCEAHHVESIHALLHDPQGLYEKEAATHAYLRPREEMNPWSFVETIRGVEQTGDVPTQGLLALGESELARPLGYSRLGEVEPLARVGRVRIYRTSR